MKLRPRIFAPVAVLAAVAGGNLLGLPQAQAAVACSVSYTVTGTWPGGFQGDVKVTNTGDAWSGWTLAFAFGAGQQLSQGWGADFSQAGTNVTATAPSWGAALASGASVSAGFIASWNGSNPVPSAFSVNGVTCNGGSGGGGATTTTTSRATSTTTTRPTSTTTTTSRATSTTTRPTTTTTRPTTTTTSRATTTTTTGGGTDSWNPPSSLTSPLAAVWSHQESTYGNLYGFKNYIFDQIMAGQGTINYCVRWDSSASVSTDLRDKIESNLARSFQKWTDSMQENGHGWLGYPYTKVQVNVVGWATRDRNLLQWSDTSRDIYVNNIQENAPGCSQACGRFFHQDGNYSGCPGGASHHYDMSLWLTAGMNGGAGGDWGQRIGSEYYVGAVNSNLDNIHILLHEIGHGYGLDDFYDWDPTPGQGFVMKAGSASSITDFDKWMLRDWWRHLKSRYGL
jgi:hypothetical protein